MFENWLLLIMACGFLACFLYVVKRLQLKRKVGLAIKVNSSFAKASETKAYQDISSLGYEVMQSLSFQRLQIKSKHPHRFVEKELQYLLGTPGQQLKYAVIRLVHYVCATALGVVTFILCAGLLIEVSEESPNNMSTNNDLMTELEAEAMQSFYYNEEGEMLFPYEDYSSLSFPLNEKVITDYLFTEGFVPDGYSVTYEGENQQYHVFHVFEHFDTHIAAYDWLYVDQHTGEVFSEFDVDN